MVSNQDFALEGGAIKVPLDYYRILGIANEATLDQIEQAYRDRSLQMPRSEYTEKAIISRQELIRASHQILSDPEKRESYDAQFNASTPPELTISPKQFVGSLVILQELGEYEQVLKLAQSAPDLNSDIILSLALANLEIGRERWQQGKYEKAASSLIKGQNLLTKENIFIQLQSEIQQDIYKLRPYRILELLSLNLIQTQSRQKGLNLLKEMLDQRQGIEGKGNDYSGLNIDDFLRFIQQIQSYMTVSEQQEIFEKEAKRPSAVATYLAFYAFLARGFSEKKPALIWQSKKLLKPLLKHQDIYLEQAVCHLLLGETDAALNALNKSQETQTMSFIRQQSPNSQDLLPGLCLYTERWLELDVFPHFRDLVAHKASLEDYFANLEVQKYLDNLPSEQELVTSETNISTLETLSIRKQLENANSLQNIQPKVPQKEKEIQESNKVVIGEANRESVTPSKQKRKPKVKSQKSQFNFPLWKIILASLLGIGFLTVISTLWRRQSTPNPELAIGLNNPVITIPEPVIEPTTQPSPTPIIPEVVSPNLLDSETAKLVIEKWFDAKSKAYGIKHEIDSLKEILTGSLLTEKERIANLVKQQNIHRDYEHFLKMESVQLDKNNPNKATAIVQVRETAKYYQNQRFLPEQSYTSNLRVSYDLIKVDGKWLISKIQVVD